MNRKQRRSLENKFGIRKHVQKLSFAQWSERVRNNIVEGKSRTQTVDENNRISETSKKDQIDNNKIASIATDIMINEGLSYIDALEKAKNIYEEEKK